MAKRTETTAARRKVVHRRGRRSTAPKQPFSLILNPDELAILRKMARKNGTSVAAVIRQALNTVIFQAHPELVKQGVERDVNEFLDRMSGRLPGVTASKQKTLARDFTASLLKQKR